MADQSNMLEGEHNLNGFMPEGDLPDGTAKSHRGGSAGSLTGYHAAYGPTTLNPDTPTETADSGKVSADDLNRGFVALEVQRTQPFDPNLTGENSVGDPYSVGGVCGRPRGFQR